ncbi:unnamed protein product [Paramecium pentaurelia]|uniref:Transmembrane protein n=1 Tax=Paramecium pentaurelia TaxID=43138 RepID=A0A8S1V756_9CILI|nr:unnamed protein product [Paramecium pentaurelia]
MIKIYLFNVLNHVKFVQKMVKPVPLVQIQQTKQLLVVHEKKKIYHEHLNKLIIFKIVQKILKSVVEHPYVLNAKIIIGVMVVSVAHVQDPVQIAQEIVIVLQFFNYMQIENQKILQKQNYFQIIICLNILKMIVLALILYAKHLLNVNVQKVMQ